MVKKKFHVYLILCLLLVGTIYFALTTGASGLNSYNLIFNIRLPRIISALLAGGGLAVSGAFFQAALRNPIAEPSLLGVSSAANLFALVGGLLLPNFFTAKLLLAVLGGCLAFLALSSFQKNLDPYRLILVGVALNAVFVALGDLLNPNQNANSLATSTWTTTLFLAVLVIVSLILAILLSPWANYLKISDQQLQNLGLSPRLLRLSLLSVATLIAATATASVGILAFIGIIVPHHARFLLGHDYRDLIVFCALGGGELLLLTDTIGRLIIAPHEIPANILLAIIGGPFLIYILLGGKKDANS